MNKVMLIGRLGVDPELKQAGSSNVCNFTLATTEKWTDKSGEKKERTEWHRIIAWGKQGEVCAKFLKKGSQVYVEGKIQTRSWENKEGKTQYATEILLDGFEFLGGKPAAQQTQEQQFDDAPPF